MKTKTTALLLCFFLGALGGHKFYLGQTGWGIAYLLLCWTVIPSIAAFVEFIMFLIMTEDEFNRKYNGATAATASVKDSTSALSDLKKLYDDGVITVEEYEEKRKKMLKNI
ncbi:NINE protein [Pseudanabaena sp. 'Roaring Creek']|uniref:NINE protein n=1 Tax=Pseudanabaena sp. 'Roaring Creek' TaxID=1681830 RepID=UPI0006D851D1|nr:NINE protein [Pseudanabaena sp. 'Roaring Creek']